MELAPLALFVYNRPTHARAVLESLRNNPLSSQTRLFIFSDAPKCEGAQDAVRQVRECIRTCEGFRSIEIVEREQNLGLARSIVDGVTRLCEAYGRVIVVEDDLVVSSRFLSYQNDALERFSGDERVFQISGYMFPVDVNSAADALFLPLTTSWGWGTWKRSWKHFDPFMAGYKDLVRDRQLRRRFNLGDSYDYFSMLERRIRGEVDSWAIVWYLSVFALGGLTLYPRRSLVLNTGFDGSGVHCGPTGPEHLGLDTDFSVRTFPEAGVDRDAEQSIWKHYAYQRSFKGRVLKKLGNWLR